MQRSDSSDSDLPAEPASPAVDGPSTANGKSWEVVVAANLRDVADNTAGDEAPAPQTSASPDAVSKPDVSILCAMSYYCNCEAFSSPVLHAFDVMYF